MLNTLREFIQGQDPSKVFSYGLGFLTTLATLVVAILLYVTRNEQTKK